MSQTVVGIFNNADEAQRAVQKLLDNGFDEKNVDYARGSEAEDYVRDDQYRKEEYREHESGIGRFFKNLFGDDDESNRYTRVAKKGYIVTVHAQSTEEARRASELLDEFGAVDVDETDREYAETNREAVEKDREYGRQFPNANADTYFDSAEKESRKIPVIEENLNVGKKVVEKGGVRIHSRIVEKPVEKTIRLREEHVRVERNKVDKPLTNAEFNDFREETVEVREHAEVPVVTKDANVVEEVAVNKTVDEREETVRDNVRKKEVDVEDYATKNKKTNP